MLDFFNLAYFIIGFITGSFLTIIAGLTAAHYAEYEQRKQDLYKYGSSRSDNKKRIK